VHTGEKQNLPEAKGSLGGRWHFTSTPKGKTGLWT